MLQEGVIVGNNKFSSQVITVSAMLIALGVILSFLRIPLSTVTEITLTGLPIAVGGYMFGPWIGFLIGALIDICGYFASPRGAFFPGFTISTALTGMIYGLLLYRRWWDSQAGGRGFAGGSKKLLLRIAAAHLLKTVFISLMLNCFWLSIFYGMDFSAVFLASVPKEAINFPIEVFLIFSIIRVLRSFLFPGERV
jgi:ECF transporter S component (folate family)